MPIRARKGHARSRASALILAAGVALVATGASAEGPAAAAPPTHKFSKEHGSLSEVSHKLSDPTSNMWALFTEFDLSFSDGDANTGDPRVGGDMVFQPILPIPVYGEGKDQWKILARPAFSVIFSNPVPTGFNRFDNEGGLGDTILPFPLIPPLGHWMVGVGPTFLMPTATKNAFGREQFGIGPTAIIGYKNQHVLTGIFPQYFFKVGSVGDQAGGKPDASFGNFLYFLYWNLPGAWQVGFNPVITYDHKATKGNKWNVPVGLLVTKTVAIGKRPVKFEFGLEYSVVSEDDFGKRFLMKLNVLPVIRSLIQKPLFGGG